MRFLLVAALLFRAIPAFALAATPEIPLSPAELAPTSSVDAKIATNGAIHVAVWSDFRNGKSTYAARLRADGTLLDRVGIRIAQDSQAGAVIWSGSTFLIAYLEEGMVTVRSLSPDGILGEPIEVFGNYVLAPSYSMKMATNGDSVLLVTSDATAAILGPDGHERRQISFPWLFAQRGFGVAAVGSTYFVAAGTSDGHMKTQIVKADGDFGTAHTFLGEEVGGLDVSSDGKRFLTAWGRAGNVYLQFTTPDGEPDGSKINLSMKEWETAGAGIVRLVRSWHEYVLVYHKAGEPGMLRLDDLGNGKPAPLTRDFTGMVADVALYGLNSGVLVGREADVLTAAVFDGTPPSIVRKRTTVSVAGKRQLDVRLARVADGIVSAWTSHNEPNSAVLLSRGPGSEPLVVAESTAHPRLRLIDVVNDNGTIWVIWIHDRKLYVRRYTPALQALDPEPVYVIADLGSADTLDFAAAAGGGAVVIVRNETPEALWLEPFGPHVVAHVLHGTANGIDQQTVGLASVPGHDRLPAIAWNGSAFEIAWANATNLYQPQSLYYPDDRIYLVRMSAAGQVLTPDPIEIVRTAHLDALRIANGWIVWQTYQTPDLSSRRHTFAVRAAANATVVDLGGVDTYFGALAADNGGYLLTRARFIDETTIAPEVVTLDANLAVTSTLQLEPITVETIWWFANSFDAAIAGGPMRTIAYSRIGSEDYGHVRRLFVRRLTDTPRRRALR